MTYCLGILLPGGLIMASDSRSNAGVDQITKVKKTAFFGVPGERAIAVLSAGNLATTQAVVTILRQAQGTGVVGRDLNASATMFDAAQVVGATLREVIALDGPHVSAVGSPDASFLIGGQINGEATRLFQIYPPGNFIEATARNLFLQNGETKYGKPILDRALHCDVPLHEAAKIALLSFDATIRSNLSVAPPIDLWRYAPDTFTTASVQKFDGHDQYFQALRTAYADGLSALIASLPDLDAP